MPGPGNYLQNYGNAFKNGGGKMVSSLIGASLPRTDALAKVTGKAKYTGDFMVRDMLVGKILRSPYAHAKVTSIDVTKAKALPGVEAVLTYQDIPQNRYATAGHPYSLDPKHRDVADKTILTARARFVGDEIAAVVAVDEATAVKALKLIAVEYEMMKPLLSPEAALEEGAPIIHDEHGSNILNSVGYHIGDIDKVLQTADHVFDDEFETSIVQHCAMENHVSYAYVDDAGRIVIVTSTQIPHICRRIVGQALGIPWGKVRVIKPYVGGGFGSKQDVCLEPLNAVMTLAVGGRPVKLDLSREESMIGTRTRHAIRIKIKTGVSKTGKLLGIKIDAVSNTGAYASHGHSILMAAGAKFKYLYVFEAIKYSPRTVYTNLPIAGAMRGYGSPQLVFALESHLDNIARKLKIDPIELRWKNFNKEGYADPITGNKILSCGIKECVQRGKELIDWDKKKARFAKEKEQAMNWRRGLGMACFSYGTGTFPAGLEVAGARIVLNQDGSVQLQIGAPEIGQGSDTVFTQMVAETIGIPTSMVHLISTQDTDISPYDPGCFASRQTYVTGMAIQKASLEIKEKILEFAQKMIDVPATDLDIKDAHIVYKYTERVIMPLTEVALQCFYDPLASAPITSDVSHNARFNAISFGATFVEVEVDIKTGQVEIIEIINVHDSGKIINRQLAQGQVHGGVSMAIGYALSEQMLFEEKTGRPLNNNFLDYKLPTILDTPDISVDFVETVEPTGPYGNKSLGEPPVISPAPAIRNAILDATGVAFNQIPIRPQIAFEKFKAAGLI
ncbi:MAG TPA: xanthine dehydrogenase molybdenum-binding subunit XdhA [Candidatus Limnocylindrales bacterium]|nr:xanthine dehydrogenase molybdenum-binding subunit XdhA [Candidatus Limnocylindrales bacterium]